MPTPKNYTSYPLSVNRYIGLSQHHRHGAFLPPITGDQYLFQTGDSYLFQDGSNFEFN